MPSTLAIAVWSCFGVSVAIVTSPSSRKGHLEIDTGDAPQARATSLKVRSASPHFWFHRVQKNHSHGNRSVSGSNSTRDGSRMLDTAYSIKGVNSDNGYEGAEATEYLYVSSFGVGTQSTSDGDNTLWHIHVQDDGRVHLESKGFSGEYLDVEKSDDDCMVMCSYEAYTCSSGGFFSSCEKNWKLLTPQPRSGGPLDGVTLPAGAVLMYHSYQESYLQHDGYTSTTPSGLWVFDPALPSSAIAGTQEIG